MNLFFFQNCISPHQIPFIEELSVFTDVDRVVVYDVLVLPSKHDGWGAVVNEALTMGLYVVTSNHCGASYLLKDRQQGIVFNLESSSSLNNVIDTCIANRDWIRKTVNERIAWSKDHISCKAVAHYFMQNL